ncbi:MAG: hypothetical protein ACOY0T_16020 [Myxococcota bacterium]
MSEPGTRTSEPAQQLVLLISERPDDPFIERIRAELLAIGFVTQRRKNDTPLEQAARDVHAVAAIRILPTRQGVEVWMADQTSGRSLLRQVIVDESPGGPNHSLIALQTAELLRTSLFARAAAEPSAQPAQAGQSSQPTETQRPPATPAATPDTPANAPPNAPSVAPPSAGLEAALGALYSPGGSDAALQLWISLERSLSHHVALALDLSAPLRAAALDGPEGTAHIGTYLVGAVFLLQTRTSNGRWFVNAGPGLAAMRLSFDASPNAPLFKNASGVTTAAAYARSDFGVELVPWLRLGARATSGVAFDRIDVRFAGNQAGSWGRFFAGAFFLAEVPWR